MLFRATLLAAALAVATPALAAHKDTLTVGIAAQDLGQFDPHFAVSTIDRIVLRENVPNLLGRRR